MPWKKYYKPRPVYVVVCGCGCGQVLEGTYRRKYVNSTHRSRAMRQRRAAASA